MPMMHMLAPVASQRVRALTFDDPEPQDRCHDVDAAVGRVSPTSGVTVDERQQVGDRCQRGNARRKP